MRHHRFGRDVVLVVWLLVASLIAVVQPASVALASDQSNTARLVRTFDLDDLSISNPAGLAFSTADDTFHVLESTRGASDVAVKQISPHEVPKGLARITAQVAHPVNITYDDVHDRLLMYATPINHIISVATNRSGDLDPKSLSRTTAHSFGVSQPMGLAVDPATGDLLVLDLGGPKIVRIAVGSDGSFLEASGEVQLLGLTDPTSLAVHPNTGHLFVASSTQPQVYELSSDGDLLTTWDVSEAEISTPGGMVFAASGDLTDAPSQVSLYITDTGEAGPSASQYGERVASVGTSLRVLAASEQSQSEGQIVEVSLVEQQATAAATETFAATMIQEIEAFNWSPPSPDTSGVIYLPASNTLMAVDGEVNEMPIYAGANVFESMLNGNLIDTWTTLDFGNNEPTGVGVDPNDGTLYISRDTPPKEVYVWDPGANGTYETTDNITSFVTADFGATDPEGVSYAVGLNRLFIADGLNNEIYQLSPGSNGVFDGVAPAGDDVVVDQFDTLNTMGMEDPEGVAYNPDTDTLYLGGKTRNIGSYNFDTILEVTTSGSLVRHIDVSDINPGRQNRRQKLSGLAYGPSSGNPSEMVLYIADRGEDNNQDPNENDGRVYEVTLPVGGGGPTNNPPVAVNDQATTSQDTPVNIDVADNDTDQDGNLDLSTVSTVAPGPLNGVTSDNNNGTIDYTPDPGFNGIDDFDYEICDTDGLCDTATVMVTVTQPNDPPTANPDSASTNEDSSVVINVASNDTDPQGNGTLDVSSVVTVSGPSNGGTTDNGNGTITYTPNLNFNGGDQFTYEICDDLGLCDTAVVDVTVDPVADPPVANPDTASTPANTSVSIDVASNDSDPDGDLDLASVSTVSGPANGNTVDNADGTIEYTPVLDYSGSDSFTYEICDNTTPTPDCDQAQVDITISGDQVIYVTSTSGGSVGGVSFKDEDILALDTSTGTWSMYFDGSDVGLGTGGQEVDGFHLETDGSILLTFGAPTTLSGAGSVDDHDIVRFTPTSTGTNTSGTYQMFFNGEDHGLTDNGEDIDAFGFAPGGDLVVSTRGFYSVPGVSGKDADLIVFDGSSWSLYMDGVSVGLDGGNTEDVTATWIDGNGDVYLSVRSSYTVPNLTGDAEDIFVCDPPGSAPITSCTFTLFWDGGQDGFGGEALNGMFISGGGGGGPVNNPPVAVNDQATTSQDTPVNIDVADNDTDQDGNLDLSTVSTVAPGPLNGVTSDNNNGTIDYTPDPGFNGIDDFDYEICDTDGLCDTATVMVTVTQPNDPPTANPDSASTNEDSSVVINVASNDTDPQGNGTLDVSSVVTVSGPSNGGTTDNGNGTITYTPNLNFNGGDQFTYEICDDLGLCDTAVVDVTVDPVADPPVANPDTASTPANTSVSIDVASNDSDPDGDLDLASVSTVSGPANGNTVDNADGTIEYTPVLDYSGSDSFTYEICDNTTPTPDCDQAQVDITISGDQVIYVTSTSGGSVGGVSFKDEDILALDTSTGTWSMYFDGSDVGLGTGGQEVDGFHLETDGSILLTFGAPTTLSGAGSVDDHDIVRFTPTSTGTNTSGTYQMFFNGEDHGLTDNGEDIDAFGFAPGGDLVVSTRGFYSVPGVSGKDADLIVFDGSSWSLYMDGVSVGLDGGNTEDVTATWIDGNGDVYLSVRSSYTVPNLTGDAEDIFVCDPPGSAPITSCTFTLFWDGGQDGFGGEALNGMFISGGGGGGPVNSPPNAVDDNAVTPVSTPVLVNVASNDSDPDGNLDPSTAATNTGPSNGGTTDNGDGTITYTPSPGYTGPDSFTYDICDTDGACDTATVDITVTQPNDPPIAGDDNATTDEDTAVVIDVSSNDSDPDGNLDPSSAATNTGPSNGGTTDNGNGTITYTPNLNFNGGDSFTYVICDSLGACDTASVNVTVNPINDQPVATDDSASTSVDTSVVVNVASNDSDVDGNLVASSAVPTSDPPNGTAAGNGDGTITYTPDPGYSGSDSFTYEICDSGALCDSATVDVNVTGGGGGGQVLYLSSTSGGSVGGVSFKDEDILALDTDTSTWSMYFDGSDVGLGASGQELDAFHLNSDGSILLSLGADGTIPDVGAVEDHDILRFIPTSTGDSTSGTYEMYFNGEDHDLTDNGEDIDSIGIAPDGRLVVSLRGYYSVPNLSGTDVDLLAFDFGSGTWSLYMDGVAVGLDAGNTEDLSATWIDSNGDVYMSVRSSFTVPGLSGDSADVFTCAPQNSNPITSCTYSMFWDGSANGFGSESINGLFIGS